MSDAPRSPFEKLVTRGITPVGFAIALLAFLFLPCSAMSYKDLPAHVTDLSTMVSVLDLSSTGGNIAVHQSGFDWTTGPRVLAIATLLAMAAGTVITVTRPARRRPLYAAITAVTAGALLTATGLRATAELKDAVRNLLSALFTTIPKSESAPLIDQSGQAAGLQWGFWTALTLLVLIAALNVAAILHTRTRHRRRTP
ncbi:hypothetical protein ACFOY4_38190 [Actinomadura syzygii]|uniref:Uncharacterized protein n=1 Tax=Actinomadura syzygii TaxID=1427538 RepID=A0A5D0U3C3_9ACTN|nr:hypothetical protein [Actinomadura syzygii]TYC13131.1 hypothetical protein FXF65_21730 [Actinomadura syzygii]